MYRFGVLKEDIPLASDPTTWCHLPVLRSVRTQHGKVTEMSADSLSDAMRRMLQLANVELVTNDAITHLGRHQAQVEAQKANVAEPDINRACNYELGQREKHYSVIVPPAWQYQRSGDRHEDPEDVAAHHRAIFDFQREADILIGGLVPGLLTFELEVTRVVDDIARLPWNEQAKARKERKVRKMKEFSLLLRTTMRMTLAILAARERGEDNHIRLDAWPLYRMFSSSPLVASLQVHGIRLIDHPLFLTLVGLIDRFEREEEGGAVCGTPRTKRQAKATAEMTRQLIEPTLEYTRKAAAAAVMSCRDSSRALEHNGLEVPLPPYLPPNGTRPLLDGGFVVVPSSTPCCTTNVVSPPPPPPSSIAVNATAVPSSFSSHTLPLPAAAVEAVATAYPSSLPAAAVEVVATASPSSAVEVVPSPLPTVADCTALPTVVEVVPSSSSVSPPSALGEEEAAKPPPTFATRTISSEATVPLSDTIRMAQSLARTIASAMSVKHTLSPTTQLQTALEQCDDLTDEVIVTGMKRGLEAALEIVEAAHEVEAITAPPNKSRRTRQMDLALDGQLTLKPLTDHCDSFDRFWSYWRDVVYPRDKESTVWRTQCQTVNREYNSQLFFVREVARQWQTHGKESEAIAQAQVRLEEAGSWTALHKMLKQEQPSGVVRDTLNKLSLRLAHV